MTTNSQPNSNRSCDFMQMLVNVQTGVQQAPPTSSPYYLGDVDGVPVTDSFAVVHPGPPYICGDGALGTTNTGYCGFCTCY